MLFSHVLQLKNYLGLDRANGLLALDGCAEERVLRQASTDRQSASPDRHAITARPKSSKSKHLQG